MKILVLDNYDSFVYNLVHIIRELGYGNQLDIVRNDKITLDEVDKYDKILLSPGPGVPSEAGIMMDLIKKYGPSKSILGVCLGHQAVAEVYGAGLVNLDEVVHGLDSITKVTDTEEPLFRELPEEFATGRYHSWTVDPQKVPDVLKLTATSDEDSVMALSHRDFDVKGVQFHPESILTEHGKQLIRNWLEAGTGT